LEKISFVGLGKLGLCLACCFAVKGYEVIGIDINENVVNSVNKGISPIVEPRLQEFITKAGANLRATKNYKQAILETDITFILVATPSNPDGSFSNKHIEMSLKSLADCLKESNKKQHLFVISSTVMATSIENSFIPLIEKHSGRKLNDGFNVCYDPDFVALGNVIKGFLTPDFVIIGQSSKAAGDQIASIHHRVCENNPPVYQMSLINAEISKIALNCYICTKISFANALANLCEQIPHANADIITKAISVDKRISPHYFSGGLSYGGTCFPRDTLAFQALAKKFGYRDTLIKAVDEVNEYQHQHLCDITLKKVAISGVKKVSILGLAFKQDTPVIEKSPAIRLIERLLEENVEVFVYDPLALENTKAVFSDRIQYSCSVEDCVSKSPVCVITTPDREFKNIDTNSIIYKHVSIIDCWRILDPTQFGTNIEYIAWGSWPEKMVMS
jgi:UDPglucose 6-dehydrogenase